MSSVDRRDQRRRGIHVFLGLFQCAGTILTIYGGPLIKLPWWEQLLILACVTLAVIVMAAVIEWWSKKPHPPEPAISKIMEIAGHMKIVVFGAVRWMVDGLPGIVAVIVVFSLVAGWRSFSVDRLWSSLTGHESCGEPVDLRVVTGQENVAPLTEAARRYVAAKSKNGCRPVTVTVTGNSSLDELKDGFAGGWVSPGSGPGHTDCEQLPPRLTLLGPRPDIWIPDSRETAEWVREYVDSSDACSPDQNPVRARADLTVQGSVGSSPMVMGVFADADRHDLGGKAGKQNLTSLLRTFRVNQVLKSVARPSPDTSESALLATPVLYQALRSGGWAGGDDETAEKLLEQGLSAGDPTSMLCRFRADDAAGKDPPSDFAVIVPESVIARYDHGDELRQDVACRGRSPSVRWRLYPFYTSDLPVLDHPFVHVRWPGEDTGRRNRAVDDFRDWLERGELVREGLRTAQGRLPAGGPRRRNLESGGNDVPELMPAHPLRGGPGCAGSLGQVLECYDNARPSYPLNLLIDVSGSMANPVAAGGPRLARAQEIAQRVVAGVRPETPIRLFLFSSTTRPMSGPVAMSDNAATREDVAGAVQRAATDGRDLALATAIDQTVPRLQQGRQTLVLLTDGQVPETNRDGAALARDVAEKVKADRPGLRVLTVLTGPSGCHDQPVAAITDAFGESSCLDRPRSTADDFASLITSEILWR